MKKWTEKTNVHVLGPNDTRELFQMIEDETNDSPIKLPIITLRQRGGYTITNTAKRPMTYDGYPLEQDKDFTQQLCGIPISIPYQIDIYARKFQEADLYCRDIIFNLINHSTLSIIIPYNDANYEHTSTIVIDDVVDDNSDISERLALGQFTRMTITFNIDDAYLWSSPIKGNWIIGSDESELHAITPGVDVVIEPLKLDDK